MRTFQSIAILAFAAAVTGTTDTASAQDTQRQPSQVPIELVTALVAGPFAGGPAATRIFVGAPPNGVAAADLPPKPVSVLGGMATGQFRAVVLVYPAADPDPAGSYMKFLEGAGWTHPKVEMQRSGFVAAGDLRVRSSSLCHDSALVTVITLSAAPSANAWVRADFYPERGMSPCTMRARTESTHSFEEFVFPILEAPPGSRAVGSSGGGGSIDSREISTTLQTTLTPPQLLAHYGAQLQKSGWTVGTPLAGDSLSVERVTAKDPKGREWSGALTVVGMGAESHVTVQMARRAGSTR